MTSISVIVPVYNSHQTLPSLYSDLVNVLGEYDLEIILVDDGSVDSSWNVIRQLKAENKSILKGIRLARNFGQDNAVICGLNHCSKDYIVTIDDDLQYSAKSIPQLYSLLKDGSKEIVYGIPKEKRQNFIRRAGFSIIFFIARLFNEKPEVASSFRFMKKSLADKLKSYQYYYIRVDDIIKWHTTQVAHCQVEHHKRTNQQSGYTTVGLVHIVLRSSIAYSAIPLKLFSLLFSLTVLLGFLIVLQYLFVGRVSHIFLSAVSLGTLMFLSLMGAILFAYLHHITNYINNKPCYHISEQV